MEIFDTRPHTLANFDIQVSFDGLWKKNPDRHHNPPEEPIWFQAKATAMPLRPSTLRVKGFPVCTWTICSVSEQIGSSISD